MNDRKCKAAIFFDEDDILSNVQNLFRKTLQKQKELNRKKQESWYNSANSWTVCSDRWI
jgi:hypothetical protein